MGSAPEVRGDVDPRRAGIAMSDALVFLSLVSLIFAIVYPRIRRVAYEQRVDAAISNIETLGAAARRHFEQEGAWPAEAPSGMIPAELVGDLPDGFSFEWEHYTVDWNLWKTVRTSEAILEEDPSEDDEDLDEEPVQDEDPEPASESITTIHPLAGITIYSDEQALLAMLLERYGADLSFVRDGSWTLILEEAG